MSIELKDTLNLPSTRFPMRANLVAREPERFAHWEQSGLYDRIQTGNQNGPRFVLHDGPPFTNGDVHIGTALNKLLKDTILRYKSMQGQATPYIPGWDCHGLPIEHKVARSLRDQNKSLDPVALREACAAFSASYIETQRAQFKRLGVLADWSSEYRTMDPAYEADILRTFAAFVEQNLVYRSKKPVYWSIPCETALAEAEIEYKDHVSPSIWVAFDTPRPGPLTPGTRVVIWTTTPWTLPANLAVAVHPELEYVEVVHGDSRYLVAAALAESFIADCHLEQATLGPRHTGRSLEGVIAQHPFIDRPSPVVLADYITTDTGTGCVHTAPGHGLEDYLTGQRYGLEVYCPLDDQGCYVDDGQIPASLVGQSVLEQGGRCPANEAVLAMIKANGSLLHSEKYTHQYPHCWRSKTPVIFRAMDQWFIALDQTGTRTKALDAIGEVEWIPAWGENRIRGAVESRPDWCISRQRAWGVPIPVFYDEAGTEAFLDAGVIRALADKIAREGTDFWFKADPDVLLEGINLPPHWPKHLVKGTDTLDVWIDSGSSHQAVLKNHPALHWPADLYLEGSDQHRGWFQSSLWTAVVADGRAPYRKVITHGFIVDENKRKISKSDGKPQTADDYIKKFGADVIRLWISSQDYQNDIPVSDGILSQVVNTYRSIRNTLMYQLGNLHDFDPTINAVAIEAMDPLDRWALHQTNQLIRDVTQAFEAYEFHRAHQLIDRFCGVTLSRVYHDILKDRLYTYGPDWQERRSAQTAMHHIFHVLCRLLAPVLPHTTDEAYAHAVSGSDYSDSSIHLQPWPQADAAWDAPAVEADFEVILAVRSDVNDALEKLRQDKTIGKSLDAEVELIFKADDSRLAVLRRHESHLPEWFIVSKVSLITGDDTAINARHAEGVRCPRSWRWVPELVEAGEFGPVSPRCRDALSSKFPTHFPTCSS